ncbi:HAMP domain-containing protein [Chloroflexales bacterium ZM16-3]|nr:HAMP domain-containing protein [Chloroflexales bacterium ZM16-3]
MRPRIFILMLTAFALVIILGVGGMLGFFGLAVANFESRTGEWSMKAQMTARDEVRQIEAFYGRRGSWDGVGEWFSTIERRRDLSDWQAVTLVDDHGRVLASTQADPVVIAGPSAPPVPPQLSGASYGNFTQSMPISSGGRVVGSLLISYDGGRADSSGAMFDGRRLVQGFASAGLALAAILLALAAFFSRQISRPMGQLTRAAQSLAAGDMTARVRPSALREVGELAVAFNRMAETLVEADQQRRQLTADVAHELRTPLSIIKGRLEGIQDGVYAPDAPQIDGLLSEVALLERLIDDLRLLALAEAGQLPLYPESVEPAQLARDAGSSFTQQAAGRGVGLRLEIADNLPEITVDPQRIAQVLGNLLGNALRHTPAGGSVTLSAEIADCRLQIADSGGQSTINNQQSEIVFRVSDTGGGIAAEDLPHIFDRFYRADRARTRSSGGAGLGLAIARRMVEAHGGEIRAESAPGAGTTVSFTIPVGP